MTELQLELDRTSGVVEVGGMLHPYLIEGRGVPCIVAGIAPFYRSLFSDELKQHVRFVFVEFKNTWMAERLEDPSGITMATLTEEIDQVRRALDFDEVCVLGHSAPGLIPLEYARRYPDRTSHAVAIGTPPFFRADYDQVQQEFWDADASEERKAARRRNRERIPDSVLEDLTPREAFALDYVREGPLYWRDPTYDCYWIWQGRYFSAEMTDHFFGTLLADYDLRPNLSEIESPVFLALGRYDYAVPYRLWDGARDDLPDGAFHLFEESGHFPMLEERKRFDRSLVTWLEGRRGR